MAKPFLTSSVTRSRRRRSRRALVTASGRSRPRDGAMPAGRRLAVEEVQALLNEPVGEIIAGESVVTMPVDTTPLTLSRDGRPAEDVGGDRRVAQCRERRAIDLTSPARRDQVVVNGATSRVERASRHAACRTVCATPVPPSRRPPSRIDERGARSLAHRPRRFRKASSALASRTLTRRRSRVRRAARRSVSRSATTS